MYLKRSQDPCFDAGTQNTLIRRQSMGVSSCVSLGEVTLLLCRVPARMRLWRVQLDCPTGQHLQSRSLSGGKALQAGCICSLGAVGGRARPAPVIPALTTTCLSAYRPAAEPPRWSQPPAQQEVQLRPAGISSTMFHGGLSVTMQASGPQPGRTFTPAGMLTHTRSLSQGAGGPVLGQVVSPVGSQGQKAESTAPAVRLSWSRGTTCRSHGALLVKKSEL